MAATSAAAAAAAATTTTTTTELTWSSFLKEGVSSSTSASGATASASTGGPRVGHVIMIGPAGTGKSTLLKRLEGQNVDELPFDYGAAFGYRDAKEDGSERLVGRACMWSFDPRFESQELLKQLLTHDSGALERVVFVVVINLQRAGEVIADLRQWLKQVGAIVDGLGLSRDRVDGLRAALERRVQLAESAATAPAKASGDEKERELLPLGAGVLEVNYGVPIIVVCAKSDSLRPTNAMEQFRTSALTYHLRRIALQHGAALVSTSAASAGRPSSQEINVDSLSRYIDHVLFGVALSRSAEYLNVQRLYVPIGSDSGTLLGDLEARVSGMSEFGDFKKIETLFPSMVPVARATLDAAAASAAAVTQSGALKEEQFLEELAKSKAGDAATPSAPSKTSGSPSLAALAAFTAVASRAHGAGAAGATGAGAGAPGGSSAGVAGAPSAASAGTASSGAPAESAPAGSAAAPPAGGAAAPAAAAAAGGAAAGGDGKQPLQYHQLSQIFEGLLGRSNRRPAAPPK